MCISFITSVFGIFKEIFGTSQRIETQMIYFYHASLTGLLKVEIVEGLN